MSDDDSAQHPPRPATKPVLGDNKTLEFNPRPETIRALVWKLSANTDNISWSRHALERMAEREISDKYALDAMRRGMTKGAIEAGQNLGEWKVKMTHQAKGRREVGVVVITVRNERLLVKTVEWEDLR